MAKKALGRMGSWFATIDGESLPCVHDYWCRAMKYNDTGLQPGEEKAEELVAAIKQCLRVVLTRSQLIDPKDLSRFKRKGYIAVFGVANVEFDDAGLRFDLVRRVCDLK